MVQILPENNPTGLLFKPELPIFKDNPSDNKFPIDRNDVTDIDETDLKNHILLLFRNDIADKREMGWIEKREYDIKSYYGLKDKRLANWPWKGACSTPLPLTPTLLDTAWANIQASIWSDPNGPVKVKGYGLEDIRTSKSLEILLNNIVTNENDIQLEQESDKNVFRTFLHGTGFLKIFYDFSINKIRVYSIDIENIFCRFDVKGLQIDENCDHLIQIIPLSYNDLQIRKFLGIYKYPDEIAPGIGIITEFDNKRFLMDIATGTGGSQSRSRDTYFIAETFLTYHPKSASAYGGGRSGAATRPRELIVAISPNGGRIQRIRNNDEKIRPFADSHAFLNPDRFFSISMPEKIRNEQESVNYAYKQNTDANDRAVSPAAFVDDTDSFNRDVNQRVPGGIYPKGKSGTISFEPVPPVERGFERQIALLWEMAERKTGVIDITQGRASAFGGKTLGEIEIRSSRADVRFSTIYKRFGRGWNKALHIMYYFINKYIPRNKKLKIIGYGDYKSIEELFPIKEYQNFGLGLTGQYDFDVSGQLISDKERENEKIIKFIESEERNPLITENKGNSWRLMKLKSEAMGVRDFENYVHKPLEADLLSVEEFIQRIMSGQKDLKLRPGIDTNRYLFELQLFMKSDIFKSLESEMQRNVYIAMKQSYLMNVAEMRAKLDLEQVLQGYKNSSSFNQSQQNFSTLQPAGQSELQGMLQ